jgi:hypothetical protein
VRKALNESIEMAEATSELWMNPAAPFLQNVKTWMQPQWDALLQSKGMEGIHGGFAVMAAQVSTKSGKTEHPAPPFNSHWWGSATSQARVAAPSMPAAAARYASMASSS